MSYDFLITEEEMRSWKDKIKVWNENYKKNVLFVPFNPVSMEEFKNMFPDVKEDN